MRGEKHHFPRVSGTAMRRLVYQAAKANGFTAADVNFVLDVFVDEAKEQLRAGRGVSITGLGHIDVKSMAPRVYHDIHAGEIRKSAPKRKLLFMPAKPFKEEIEGTGSGPDAPLAA